MAKKLKWRAILIGVGVDIGGSFVLSIIFSLLWLSLARTHYENVVLAAREMIQNRTFLVICLAIGLALVALSGFITSRVARSWVFANAAVVAVVSILFVIPFSFGLPAWYKIISFLMIIPCALLGALAGSCRSRVKP
jgi:hypothetical protein